MEKFEAVCQNKWCKARFQYTESDMIPVSQGKLNSKIEQVLDQVEKVPPSQCPKCKSFNDELSGGVSWNEKRYEGSRIDGLAHPISVNVSKYTDRKW